MRSTTSSRAWQIASEIATWQAQMQEAGMPLSPVHTRPCRHQHLFSLLMHPALDRQWDRSFELYVLHYVQRIGAQNLKCEATCRSSACRQGSIQCIPYLTSEPNDRESPANPMGARWACDAALQQLSCRLPTCVLLVQDLQLSGLLILCQDVSGL